MSAIPSVYVIYCIIKYCLNLKKEKETVSNTYTRKTTTEITVLPPCTLCSSSVDILEIETLVIKLVLSVCSMVMLKRVDFNSVT